MSTTTTTKPNLFAGAKKKEEAPATKSKTISFPTTPELDIKLAEYTEAKTNVKNWEAKMETAEGYIKEKAAEMYIDKCLTEHRHIGSFKLGGVTVSVQDKYKKLDESFAPVLEKQFPDVVETKTEYGFNQAILEKYIEQISEALSNANIPEEDLLNLIEKKEPKSIKKGTIETLTSYDEEKARNLFTMISPIISCR